LKIPQYIYIYWVKIFFFKLMIFRGWLKTIFHWFIF
jgi:hypothetical protein